ncbi:MAG: class I SAM-dependent DNA methyltransferase, partial [Methylococcus sp.]
LTTLDEQLAAFPYINGSLYARRLRMAAFDREMRDLLLECCALDWGRISPAIFGALFQSVMDPALRRNLGAHYTTEQNILKLIKPLFLDDWRAEFERIKQSPPKLYEFQRRLARLKFLDPACGCGNFLVIAYRELRLLELDVLRVLYGQSQNLSLDVASFNILCDVDQFHGIEVEEFPAQIAQTALWLMDHQMNLLISEEFGNYFARLPLRKSATIVHGNALRLDWREVVPPEELDYILGNPPFVGAKYMNDEQRADIAAVFMGAKGAGLLDYVSAWYRKAAEYMAANPAIVTAFVSTNSITQGEQVGALWPDLLRRGVRIHFAHRTFQWTSEARGKAAVHCVIIGFALRDRADKWLFDYEDVRGEAQAVKATNINPYLVDAPDLIIARRSKPLCGVPEIGIGNKPIDGGHYLFTTEERDRFIAEEPESAAWFRRWLGSDEFINGWERWCLWLGDCPPDVLRRMPLALQRVDAVRRFRGESKSAPTRKLAEIPTRFHVENIPDSPYLVIPEVSSERRRYVPLGYLAPETLASNKLRIFPQASVYDFSILSSAMHMAWMRATTGRLKSDYQYSVSIVYNNFPWPEPTDAQR